MDLQCKRHAEHALKAALTLPDEKDYFFVGWRKRQPDCSFAAVARDFVRECTSSWELNDIWHLHNRVLEDRQHQLQSSSCTPACMAFNRSCSISSSFLHDSCTPAS